MVFTPWLTVLAAASIVSLWCSGRMISASWSAMGSALQYEMNAASWIPTIIIGGSSGSAEAALESLESAPVANASAHQNNNTRNQTMGGGAYQNSAPDQTSTTIIYNSERLLFMGNGEAARDQTIPSPSRIVPRIVHLEESRLGNLRGGPEPTFKALLDVPSNPVIKPRWFAPNAHDFVGNYDPKECEPMQEWQLDSQPNCNAFHELDLRRTRYLTEGGARVVFEAAPDGDEAKVVFKTLRYARSISQRKTDEQRKDALIMERASSSQFVPDIYGYCGVGVMMPFMPGGDLLDYTRSARLAKGGSSLSPVDKLRVAFHVASGVAEVHTKSLFHHNDVAEDQFLFQDGVFKLNDFNYGGPIYVNKTSKEHCAHEHIEEQGWMWKGRSLEEFQRLLKYPNYTAPDPTKVDVWMMGNAIFTMLTDEYLFEKPPLGWKDSARKLLRGERSPYPKHIEESTNPSHAAVETALDMCWTHRWQERPSAETIARYLHSQLRQITGEDNPDIRVVLPERDPNQELTWSDYYSVVHPDRH